MVKELLVKPVLKPGEPYLQFRVFINLHTVLWKATSIWLTLRLPKTLKYLYPHLNYVRHFHWINRTTLKIFVFL
jgi:hypothetical protein